MLLASALRAGLVLGYSPVGLPSLIDRAELGSNGCRAVIEAAAEAVKRGYRRDARNRHQQALEAVDRMARVFAPSTSPDRPRCRLP